MQEKRRNYKRTIIKLLLAGFVLFGTGGMNNGEIQRETSP